jgi:imidazolonepropionase-like amidohydrolase
MLFVVCLIVASRTFCQMPTDAVLIRNVRVFDGERVREHRSVLVENGKITRMSDRKLIEPLARLVTWRERTTGPDKTYRRRF